MDDEDKVTDVRPGRHPPHVLDHDVLPIANFVEVVLYVLRGLDLVELNFGAHEMQLEMSRVAAAERKKADTVRQLVAACMEHNMVRRRTPTCGTGPMHASTTTFQD